MNFNCKLEILSDTEAVYEDNLRVDKVRARVGGDELSLRTVYLLNGWVAEHDDHCYRKELEILGRHLYKIAFGTPQVAQESAEHSYPLKEAFESTYELFDRERHNDPSSRLRLMLVLHNEAVELSALPWEFINMTWRNEGSFLAGQQTDLILARFVPESDPPRVFQPDDESEKLRILVVLSAPGELDIVDAGGLIKQLKDLQSPQIIVELLDQPTRRSLPEKIGDFKPHIMHFIGHGKEGRLALIHEDKYIEEQKSENSVRESQSKEPKPIEYADWRDSNSIKSLFDSHSPHLVFLHACKGAARELLPDSLRSFSSTARELAYTKIAAVIAMQYAISNDEATRFARKFYGQIREGMDIDEAVVVARYDLGTFPPINSTRNSWDQRTFGTPVIYLQSKKPIIRAPLPKSVGPTPGGTPLGAVQKVLCPYPGCENNVIRGRKLCLACKGRLMVCPNPECQLPMAQDVGICDNCLWGLETSAKSAPAIAPKPTISAEREDPAQKPQPPGSYDDMPADGPQDRIA